MLIKIGVALLVVLALHQTRQLRRIIKMSETFDSELTETEAAISGMTAAVNNAADKFTDLAHKLQAAIDALSQQGLSPAQLARFNDIQSHLATEAAALTAAADAADPATPPAPTPVSIVTTALPDASVDGAYTGQIEATGGTGPYTFTSSPTVDNGVIVNPDGSVTGNPTLPADSTFSVTATDSLGATGSGTVTLHTAASAVVPGGDDTQSGNDTTGA